MRSPWPWTFGKTRAGDSDRYPICYVEHKLGMHIIKVPSVYMVKLPRMWLNLATVRSVQIGDTEGKIIITYETGDFDVLNGTDAAIVLDCLEATNYINKPSINEVQIS